MTHNARLCDQYATDETHEKSMLLKLNEVGAQAPLISNQMAREINPNR
jgi:hypothetical protein